MNWTQADLDALKEALASGVQRVTLASGQTQVFRSLAEMKEIVAMAERSLAPTTKPSQRRYVTRTGWDR